MDVSVASRPAADGGLPNASGFYAWWIKLGSVPGVPPSPHPTEPGRHLLYVGIAPGRAISGRTIRTRVLDQHLGGNTGSSTFRLSLASLLMDTLQFRPLKKQNKVVLSRDENKALSDWQRQSLRITWCEQMRPWDFEAEVIASMKPPLNLAGNAAHPFYETMCEARKRFKACAA